MVPKSNFSPLSKMIFVLLAVAIWVPAASAQSNVLYESDRWERSKDAVIISDMSKVSPQSALTDDLRKKGFWKVLEYETKDGLIDGKSISTTPFTGAPNVSLDLNKNGWYAVYVGLGGMGRFAFGQESEARIKLSGDTAFQHRHYSGKEDDIEEVFFKAADLTGQKLEIAQMRMKLLEDGRIPAYPRHTVVMYVKLVPLTEKEVAWIKADRAQKDSKKLIGTMDAFSWLGRNSPSTKAEFLENFEAFRHTDFGTLVWQIVGGDIVNYDSKVGTIVGSLADDPPRTGDGNVTESVNKYIEQGLDTTEMAIEAAHSMDKKILIGFRSAAWQTPPAFEDYFSSQFYRDHPEWRTYDRDGTPVMRMSYAVPEVREHIYSLLREIMAKKPDGIEIIYFRGLPMMLWEDAFVEQFRKKYGADAKAVPENDRRIFELRGEIMTGFMRDVRKLLDEAQKEHGRREPYLLTASVVHNEADNIKYGLDVERWVKEGLIDKISIFPAAFHTDTSKPMELDWFRRITKGTKTQFYPIMIGWNLSSYEDAMASARKYYDAGSGGLTFWDPYPTGTYRPRPPQREKSYRYAVPGYWQLVSRMGHDGELQKLEAEKRPAAKYIPLKRWGNYWFGRWYPDVGF
ncbi:MAG: family 10 glycosylhydrolase [Pyrinomonadaceae bacterium]